LSLLTYLLFVKDTMTLRDNEPSANLDTAAPSIMEETSCGEAEVAQRNEHKTPPARDDALGKRLGH